MAAVVEELFQGRTEVVSSKPSAEIPYIVRQASDEAAVKSAALTGTPTLYAGMPRKSVEISERVNADTWKVVVRYEAQEFEQQEEPEPVFSFDTGGGTQHITQSFSTVGSYAAPGFTNPDFRGAIGVTQDSVEGVDITVPVYHFSETHYKPAAQVTDGYKGTLFSLTGKVNSATFRGCAAGECLFLGASGSKRGDLDWEITYRFAASPNRTNLTVGDVTGVAKKGWEYLWVHYVDDEDASAKRLVKRPAFVRVEKVYETGDFSGLGI